MDHLWGAMTCSVPPPIAEDLTLDKMLAMVRDLPPPLPRLVPVYPFFTTEVYTGHELLRVTEPNPVYDTIPKGMAVTGEVLNWRGEREKITLARADEMVRENLLNPLMLYSK